MRGSFPWAAWRSILGGCDGGGGDALNIPELSSTWLYLLLMFDKKVKLAGKFLTLEKDNIPQSQGCSTTQVI